MDDRPQPRRKSLPDRSEASIDGTPPGIPRRSSNFSDFNHDEARNMSRPRPQSSDKPPAASEHSSLALISLASALLPGIAGSLFTNGHVVTTDIMLLGFAGVYLHWSVTQPWVWYYAARQARLQQQADNGFTVADSDADADLDADDTDDVERSTPKSANLDNVPEESDVEESDQHSKESTQHSHDRPRSTVRTRAALKELYVHEILALLLCFLFPILAAFSLHYIRAQLSRPSEGLVSNFNLTIFLVVSGLRTSSHTWKLLLSRTLHLQNVVHRSALTQPVLPHVEELIERVERLEARSLADEFVKDHNVEQTGPEYKAALARDVRNAIQPELDALNRAVRRYEKKATMLQHQTEARFMALDSRLDDAIALAAVAAKNSNAKNIFVQTAESCLALVSFPITYLFQLFLLPVRSISALLFFNRRRPVARHGRTRRLGKQPVQPRYSGDMVSSRVMKR